MTRFADPFLEAAMSRMEGHARACTKCRATVEAGDPRAHLCRVGAVLMMRSARAMRRALVKQRAAMGIMPTPERAN